MPQWNNLGLNQFLSSHPRMRLVECGDQLIIKGSYKLNAQMDGFHPVDEAYDLIITFPNNFPKDLPIVIEEGGALPRSPDYHTYKDGSLCLGSDIKLKSVLSNAPDIPSFIKNILDPFLYSVTYKIKYDKFPNGELAHGEAGLIDDYELIFEVNGKVSVLRVLTALGKRKRDSNKITCPCDCGYRLGKCDYRFKLNQWRKLARRRWFKSHLSKSFSPIEKTKKKKAKPS